MALRRDAQVPRLAEIRKQYDHLEELGVTVVYFSPLFESETHGYDTVDYFKACSCCFCCGRCC